MQRKNFLKSILSLSLFPLLKVPNSLVKMGKEEKRQMELAKLKLHLWRTGQYPLKGSKHIDINEIKTFHHKFRYRFGYIDFSTI